MSYIKSNLSLYLLYYAYARNELTGPSPRHCAQATQLFLKKCWQEWRAVGKSVSNLTCSGFELQTSRSKDVRVTARPTSWF